MKKLKQQASLNANQVKKSNCSAFESSFVESVVFAANSKLRAIDEYAFESSKIESISIPTHVTKISRHAFDRCIFLSRVKFQLKSQLQTIEKYTFLNTLLESIVIPTRTIELEDGWCIGTRKLNHVEVESGNCRYSSVGNQSIIGKSDIESENMLIIFSRDIVTTKIPENIKIIKPYAFADSKLTSILIPSHVT